jgi:sugar (pentulose or hexulose) kinase
MEYILTVDIGTTSVKAILFDSELNSAAESGREYTLLTPSETHVELSGPVYWNTCRDCIRDVVSASFVRPDDIRILIITTQGETFLTLDESGEELGNAIVWIDSRAVEEAELLIADFSRLEFFENTGLGEISPIWPACKMLWLRRNEPERFKKTKKFLLLQDYILYRLTGEFVCEVSNASSSGYLNINTGGWWPKMMDYINLRPENFGRPVASGTVIGRITHGAAAFLGLSEKMIVAAGAQDQAASAIGGGNIRPGVLTENTGTALALVRSIVQPDYTMDANINYERHSVPDMFIALAVSQTSGIVLKWFKDRFCENEIARADGREVYSILDEMAATVPPGSEGLVMSPHFNGKLFPKINSEMRGAFNGLSFHHTRAHFIRAIMESVAFMLRENNEYLENVYGPVDSVISLGGGARSRLWAQIKSSVLNKPVNLLQCGESTSLGSAILACVDLGIVKDINEACARFVRTRESIMPNSEHVEIYNKAYREFLKLTTQQ